MFKSVLFYTNKLKQVRRFYQNVLRLDISKISKDNFTVQMGETQVTFQQSDEPAFYHYAVNIPGNQFSMIKYQMKERLSLNRERGIDEVYFANFDADSMYFEDPAGNIIELIGRRKRDLFGSPTIKESFLNISEVGIVSPNLEEVGDELQDIGIPLRGVEIDLDSVNFLGREEAFIVLVRPDRRWYFSEQKSETHPLELTLTDGHHIVIDENGDISITEPEEEE